MNYYLFTAYYYIATLFQSIGKKISSSILAYVLFILASAVSGVVMCVIATLLTAL